MKENQKKAIEIINNSGNWPYRIVTVVDKGITEEYYHDKYDFDKQDLKPILNEYHEDATEIQGFTSEEIVVIISKTPAGKNGGKMVCATKITNQGSDILQHSQNRPTGGRLLKL